LIISDIEPNLVFCIYGKVIYMPKLNITHLPERLMKRIEQLERGDALEARDINALLNDKQQQALKEAWAGQQALRKKSKQAITEAEKQQTGWKTIREVRLSIYRQALIDVKAGMLTGIKELQHQSEVNAARIFMDAFSKTTESNKDAMSVGNIALTRAGYNGADKATRSNYSKRGKKINDLEELLNKKLEQ
jgi:hypothetical protein